MEYVWLGLIYLLSGIIFSLVYIINFRPDNPIWIGLLVLGWPLVLVFDVLITVAKGFGVTASKINDRYGNRIRKS